LITFLSKVKYTINTAIVTYEISYDIKILTFIPLYSSVEMTLEKVNYIEF